MTPQPSEISLVGFTFERCYIAGEGIILRLQPPPKIALSAQEPAQPCLHVAFIPATNILYTPPEGAEAMPADAEAVKRYLESGEATARPVLIMRTHIGELPEEIVAASQEPTEFQRLKGLAITMISPAEDGSNGLNLIFGFQYRLQIDLTGAFVYPVLAGTTEVN